MSEWALATFILFHEPNAAKTKPDLMIIRQLKLTMN
jgi:hypothetical protein